MMDASIWMWKETILDESTYGPRIFENLKNGQGSAEIQTGKQNRWSAFTFRFYRFYIIISFEIRLR